MTSFKTRLQVFDHETSLHMQVFWVHITAWPFDSRNISCVQRAAPFVRWMDGLVFACWSACWPLQHKPLHCVKHDKRRPPVAQFERTLATKETFVDSLIDRGQSHWRRYGDLFFSRSAYLKACTDYPCSPSYPTHPRWVTSQQC